MLYQADSKKIETQENFESEINSVFCTNQKLGFIFKNEDDNGKYRMEIYNKAGKKSSTYYFDLDYSGMTADDDEVILYNDEGGRLRKSNGGAQRFPQRGRKSREECKGRRELDCESNTTSRYESRA